ncbi:related to transcription factor MBP1 [Ustilago trichophora]|uniref:Related to transcription factor MBP1 n=1 Tax=Ustilago trichophora TaxID=86804 RepID=A0A5C3EI21_9BASI|nr:related to transcription factor MBP1 [Ustilago trichophora]
MPLNPTAASNPTASNKHASEASSFPAISNTSAHSIHPLQPVQEVAASSLVDSVSSPHTSQADSLKRSSQPSNSSLSFTTSALQRAGLLPVDLTSNMSTTAASGASAASETLQRVMAHGAASAAATNGASTPVQAGPLTPAQLKNMTPAQANAALQNPVGNVPTVYLATYSNVPVYEITVRGIAVMRRRGDGWLNATQILKIAGIEKTRRTKILEKSILTGEHEKIQGGYGKFQGTWIPLQRAQEVAAEYNVSHLLQPILEFDPSTADQIPKLYQRKKPASSARNSSASAINDGRSATPSKNYSPAPSSVGGPSQQPRFLSLRPPKDTQQRELSPALFMPPGASGLLGGFAADGAAAPATQAIPPGSSQAEQEALRNYNVYGYTPQGVPLPSSTVADGAAAAAAAGDKRAAGETEQEGASAAKRSRLTSPQRDSGLLLGPSPVKDLNALGPAGGSLRAASAPRGHRMAVGPPDAAGRDGTVPRYADRALPPKPYDEGEKRMRDHLVSLFADDSLLQGVAETSAATNASPSAAASKSAASAAADSEDEAAYVAKLDSLLSDLREKASLGGLGAASGSDGPKATVDLVTDDHGHTALHWASALCRLKLVRTLVARPPWQGGANVHAGNHAGETALHRSVLVTNSYDASSFPVLLNLLAPSLNTRDFKKRTVLHHIALVAALKGRAASARYYLACVLEHISAEKSSKYKGLIDAQDEDGETALGIVARLGNASMVRMLLDVGARKDLANALGIRPSDWGIESGSGDTFSQSQSQHDGASVAGASTISSLPSLTAADLASQNPSDIISALTRPTQVPVMKSSDVRDQLSSTLDDLQSTFERELKEKQDAISTVQSHLQAATRDLAARRKTVSAAQAKLAEKDEARQRVQNLRRSIVAQLGLEDAEADARVDALEAEAAATKQTDANAMDVDSEDIKPSLTSTEPLIADILSPTTMATDLSSGSSSNPSAIETEELVRLRFLLSFYTDSCTSLSSIIAEIQENSNRKEAQCKQVVAICANIPQDKVEGMLEELLTAMESDGPDVDLARVAGFMQKVEKGGAVAEVAGGLNGDTATSV